MKTIELTQGQVAIVDDEDYEYLSELTWYAQYKKSTNSYTAHHTDNEKNVVILMHRVIMKTPDGLVVDHINHDTLDNRKENLRNCTPGENNRNRRKFKNSRSEYKGVRKKMYGWQAYITKDNNEISLGTYSNEAEAARAYDKKAVELFGEFAVLNFPPDDE